MMKRIILCSAFILSFSLLGMSQSSGTYSAKKFKIEKGWYLRPEVGVNYLGKKILPSLSFLFNVSYQINPNISIGLGSGVYSVPRDVFWYSTSFPLFTTCRINFVTTKHGFTPFFETKMGYSFGLWGNSFDLHYTDLSQKAKSEGFYGYWGIGTNWRNFDLFWSFGIINIKQKKEDANNYYPQDGFIQRYLSFTVSYNIPLKKKS